MESNNDDFIVIDEPLLFPDAKLIIKPEKGLIPSYIKLYQKNLRHRNNWILFASSDINDLEVVPTFNQSISLKYIFSQNQEIRAEIYQPNEEESVLYGYCVFQMSELVRSPEKKISMKLTCPNSLKTTSNGHENITIQLDEPLVSLDQLILKLGLKYHKATFLKRSSYYTLYEIYDDPPETKEIFKSNLVEGRMPEWDTISIRITEKLKREGLFRVSIHDKKHKIKGSAEFKYSDIVQNGKREFSLKKFAKQRSGSGFVEKGILRIIDLNVQKQTTLTDFFCGGLTFQSFIGLDFSNYFDLIQDKTLSNCFKAECLEIIKMHSKILTQYMGDKSFEAYGLGSHQNGNFASGGCYFPITGNLFDDPLERLHSSIELAFDSVEERSLLLSPFLQDVIKRIKDDVALNSKLKYYVVLVIISGPIKDFYEFIDYLILCSYEIPATFLLLGIGNEKFSQLATIEDQFKALKGSDNRTSMRKNYRFFMPKNFATKREAVSEMFNEVGRQFLEFTQTLGLRPKDFGGSGNPIHDQYKEINKFMTPKDPGNEGVKVSAFDLI